MNPVNKALWFVESHFRRELSLNEIADVCGVSRFHLTRAFGVATGHSIMEYVRKRRLSEAARSLAEGAPDILTVALEACYGSHEAFTRAFHGQFGVTPEKVRQERSLDNIQLLEPIKMDESLQTTLGTHRFENGRLLLIAGLGARYSCESSAGIPAQWQRFLPHFGHIPGQIGRKAYGVCCNSDDAGNFDYICGVEVSSFSHLPAELNRIRIPEQRYAVFQHRDHVSTIRRTWSTIWSQWLPQSGLSASGGPDIEFYGEDFDPITGIGLIEIWLPVKG
jgi:AraC family transcriptional regulator